MGKSVYSSVNSSKPVSLYFVDDLEETMAKSFVRSANLRALIFKSECPKIIQNCQPIFQRLVDPQLRDTLQTDMQILSSLTEDGDVGYPIITSSVSLGVPRLRDDQRCMMDERGRVVLDIRGAS